MSEKTKGELLQEKLFYEPKNGFDFYTDEQIDAAYDFAEGYKAFLDGGKTERECVEQAVELAKKGGFTLFDRTKTYKAGDKVYAVNNGKGIFLFIFGQKSVEEGVMIAAGHVDCPRLDLKPRPLYEDRDLAYFKTHYYGGIKKYQWTAIPLALHGVVSRADGQTVKVCIGEDAGDPVFVITDLLPHLARKQMELPLAKAIEAENLNILIGSRPFKDDKASSKVKLNVMSILNEKYGITEKDLLSAELEIVPAAKAQDVGFDRSMIGAYGHDDRVCSYTILKAALDTEAPLYSTMCVLVDKEEIGSEGVTGMKSYFMQYMLADIAAMQGANIGDMYKNSRCLSADVNAALDPMYSDVHDIRNASFLNCGICVTKYTGSGGKGGTSDASAEMMGEVSRLFADDILWQTGELGKCDAGGGGTVAKFIAELAVPTVDVGVAMLSMHAPWELVTKLDVYSAYTAFHRFFNRK